MILYLLFNFILFNINKNILFNKTIFFGYMLYTFIYYFLGNKIFFIVILDSIYLLKHYLELPTESLVHNQKIKTKKIKTQLDSSYKPYTYNLADTVRHISANIS